MKKIEDQRIQKRINKDGRELWLVEDADGYRILLMPRSGGKEKVRVELLKRLREVAASSGDRHGEALITLRGVRASEESILLEFDYIQSLWDFWESGPLDRLTPEEALSFLRSVSAILAKTDRTDLGVLPIHPSNLVKLGDHELGLMDPRIGAALEDAEPAHPARELCLPPEVVQGKPWTERSVIYAAGLTAYTLLAGVFPFGSGKLSEDASAALQEAPPDVRCYALAVSERFAELIQSTLEKKPERRPDLGTFQWRLDEIEELGAHADDKSQAEFTARIEALKQKQTRSRKAKRLWKAGRWIGVAAAVVAAFVFLSRPGYEPQITKRTPPAKVVQQFYTAYAGLDVQALQETLHKTGKEVVQMVSIKFVLSRYTPDIQARKVLQFKELKIQPLTQSPGEARYMATYRLVLINGLGKNVQTHRDSLILRPVKGIWRIVEYQSVLEKERFYKDPSAPRDRVDKASGLR